MSYTSAYLVEVKCNSVFGSQTHSKPVLISKIVMSNNKQLPEESA